MENYPACKELIASIDILYFLHIGEHHIHPYNKYNAKQEREREKTTLKHRKQMEAQGLSGRMLDSRPKGRGFEPHRRHCIVSLSKNINPSLVLVQPRKTRPFITERLLMGRKESNQTNKN